LITNKIKKIQFTLKKHVKKMKKIIIVAFAILTTGLVSSCTKENSVKPASVKSQTVAGDRTDTGSGD
jgi:hypothetical protein